MRITENKYYRTQHVNGPGSVFISIKFGDTPVDGIRIVKLLKQNETGGIVEFDLDSHVSEIVSGVLKANNEFGGELTVQEIEIIPSDFPTKGQAELAAYQIASEILSK